MTGSLDPNQPLCCWLKNMSVSCPQGEISDVSKFKPFPRQRGTQLFPFAASPALPPSGEGTPRHPPALFDAFTYPSGPRAHSVAPIPVSATLLGDTRGLPELGTAPLPSPVTMSASDSALFTSGKATQWRPATSATLDRAPFPHRHKEGQKPEAVPSTPLSGSVPSPH